MNNNTAGRRWVVYEDEGTYGTAKYVATAGVLAWQASAEMAVIQPVGGGIGSRSGYAMAKAGMLRAGDTPGHNGINTANTNCLAIRITAAHTRQPEQYTVRNRIVYIAAMRELRRRTYQLHMLWR